MFRDQPAQLLALIRDRRMNQPLAAEKLIPGK